MKINEFICKVAVTNFRKPTENQHYIFSETEKHFLAYSVEKANTYEISKNKKLHFVGSVHLYTYNIILKDGQKKFTQKEINQHAKGQKINTTKESRKLKKVDRFNKKGNNIENFQKSLF